VFSSASAIPNLNQYRTGHANILMQISLDIIKFVGFRLSKAKFAQNFAPIHFRFGIAASA
jgi:hypothetical protein